MTREEAIEFLKNMIDRESIGFVCPKGDGDVAVWEYHVTALNMAIKALEQPEQRWIPCRERLPVGWQWFYATCRSKVDDRENWVIEGLSSPWKLWGDLPPMVKEGDAEIIAWMPKEFPEPYREEGGE